MRTSLYSWDVWHDTNGQEHIQISKIKEEKKLSFLLLLLLHWPSLISFWKGQFVRSVSWYILTVALMWPMRIISYGHNWSYFHNYLIIILLPTQFSLPVQSMNKVPWDKLREIQCFPSLPCGLAKSKYVLYLLQGVSNCLLIVSIPQSSVSTTEREKRLCCSPPLPQAFQLMLSI